MKHKQNTTFTIDEGKAKEWDISAVWDSIDYTSTLNQYLDRFKSK